LLGAGRACRRRLRQPRGGLRGRARRHCLPGRFLQVTGQGVVRPDGGGHPVVQGGGRGHQGGRDLVQLVAPGRSEVIADGSVDERMGEGDKGFRARPVFCQQARRVCFV